MYDTAFNIKLAASKYKFNEVTLFNLLLRFIKLKQIDYDEEVFYISCQFKHNLFC